MKMATILDIANKLFNEIQNRLDTLDDKYDSPDVADSYFAMPEGTKLEYRQLMEQRELVRSVIAKSPLPSDINALNDPNYND